MYKKSALILALCTSCTSLPVEDETRDPVAEAPAALDAGHPDTPVVVDDAGTTKVFDAGTPTHAPDAGTQEEPEVWDGARVHLECDPIDPSVCGFPFPNDAFTVDDNTHTGRRLALSAELFPATDDDETTNPTKWNVADGFSSGTPLLFYFPGASTDGLADLNHIGDSLAADAKTVVLDAETGERIPHFAELDFATDDAARRALIIRPVTALDPGRRYIVGVRGIVDDNGALIEASESFASYRDGVASDERAPWMDDIFAHLEEAGVARASLQLAWDFTTCSAQNSTGRLAHMMALANADFEQNSIGVSITSVDEDFSEYIARRVRGRLTVPLFMDGRLPGAYMNLGSSGLPEQNGTASIRFTLLIPYSALDTPADVALVGHGLLSSRAQVESLGYQVFANEANFALAAVDWQGMSQSDVATIVSFLLAGEMHRFATIPDRLQQSIINFTSLRRALEGPLRDVPEVQGRLADTPVTYFGSSQGGILGAVFMASDDGLQRGILDVAGQNYSMMLTRSNDFDLYLGLMKGEWSDPRDIQLHIALVQQLWERAEPSGYARGITGKDVLVTLAIGDHQVPTSSGHIMARAMGLPLVGPVNREVFGLEIVDESEVSSALIEYDFGLPPEPVVSLPMSEGQDPHGRLRHDVGYRQMRARFLREGVIETLCEGPCDPR